MKRRAGITHEELERVRLDAEASRVKAGKPAVDPGDELYEQLQAERRRKRPAKKGA